MLCEFRGRTTQAASSKGITFVNHPSFATIRLTRPLPPPIFHGRPPLSGALASESVSIPSRHFHVRTRSASAFSRRFTRWTGALRRPNDRGLFGRVNVAVLGMRRVLSEWRAQDEEHTDLRLRKRLASETSGSSQQ